MPAAAAPSPAEDGTAVLLVTVEAGATAEVTGVLGLARARSRAVSELQNLGNSHNSYF